MKKDILINAAGIGVGQMVVLVATPVLARIYTPSEFGGYAALVAATGIIATIASLRFDVALPAVPDDDVAPLLHIALLLPVAVSIAAITLIGVLAACVDTVAGMMVAPPTWVAAIATLLGTANVCQAYFVRAGDFKRVAVLKILQPIVFTLLALAAVVGLNGAYLASWLAVLLVALWGCRSALVSLDLRRSWQAVNNARKYPILSAPVALLDTASLALPIIFIVAAYGNESAGNYSQVQRLLAAPLLLLGIAASQVFYKHAGDLHRGGAPVEPLMWRVVLSLLGVAVLLLIATVLVGEPLMALLLGAGWRTDTQFLLLSIAPVLFRMVVSPVSSVFLINNRLGLGSAWQVTYFVVTAGVIFLAKDRFDLEGYLLALAGAELAMYLLYLLLAVYAVRVGGGHRPAGVC